MSWSVNEANLEVFTDGKQHKAREIGMITLRNHAPLSCMTWLSMTLSVLDMIIVKSAATSGVTGVDFENLLYVFGQSEKR